MLDFLTQEEPGRPEGDPVFLVPLELSVMEVVWATGVCNVRDVVVRVDRDLAYTTIMTTMDRLYKKGILQRQKNDRAFLYTARLSREEWERQRAHGFFSELLTGPQPSQEVLLSCLVDAVGKHDPKLLDELQKRIQSKRRSLQAKDGAK